MGISKEEIDRISELSRKAKSDIGLNADELAERQELRQRYIDSSRRASEDILIIDISRMRTEA